MNAWPSNDWPRLASAHSCDLPFDVQHHRAHLYGEPSQMAALESSVRKAIEETIGQRHHSALAQNQGESPGTMSFQRKLSLLTERRTALSGIAREPWSPDQAWVVQTEALFNRIFGETHRLVAEAGAIDVSPYMRPVGTQFAPQGWPELFDAALREL